jgi:hypothetical protein
MDAVAESPYWTYWKAWLFLLGITLAMLTFSHTGLLIVGMTVKAAIIAFWFMHLKKERFDFVLYILVGIFATALVLFLLIMPDGRAM